MIISVISPKYSLRKATSSSGERSSLSEVKLSISEKKQTRCFFCPLKLIFHFSARISSAIFELTYSLSAELSFFLFASSIRNFTIFAHVKASRREKIISEGKLSIKFVHSNTESGNKNQNMRIIAIFPIMRTFLFRERLI